jgi:hypothetical protein
MGKSESKIEVYLIVKNILRSTKTLKCLIFIHKMKESTSEAPTDQSIAGSPSRQIGSSVNTGKTGENDKSTPTTRFCLPTNTLPTNRLPLTNQ